MSLLFSKAKQKKKPNTITLIQPHPSPKVEINPKSACLYVKDLDTPNQAIAYWMRSVNQNGIKIAGLCLEEQVSESYTDALEAALVVIHNVLELYKESKPLLAQKAETVRGKNALEKANSIYATIKSSFRTNYAYLKEVFTNDNFYISSIEETLKQLDEKT